MISHELNSTILENRNPLSAVKIKVKERKKIVHGIFLNINLSAFPSYQQRMHQVLKLQVESSS